MKKVLLGMLAVAACVFGSSSLAQGYVPNQTDQNRIASINATYDTAWGLNIPVTGGGSVFRADLKLTVGKTALWECMLWGRAVTAAWAWWWGYGESDAKIHAKSCAQNVLAPIYAQQKIAVQTAILSYAGGFNFGSYFMAPGFVQSVTAMEYRTLAADIDADWETVRTSGKSWGQLPAVPPVLRPQTTSGNAVTVTLP
jgi:hypothetical protein